MFCFRSFVLFCVLRLVLVEHKKLLHLVLIEVFASKVLYKTRLIGSTRDAKCAAICALGGPGDANSADFASSADISADPAMKNEFCILRLQLRRWTRVHRHQVPILFVGTICVDSAQ